jgi:CheY-like chemotaxis protein
LEATRQLRMLDGWQLRPIIALTANAFEEDRQACLQAGMNDFLTKPIDSEQFYLTLLRWLPQHPLREVAALPASELAVADDAAVPIDSVQVAAVLERLRILLEEGDMAANELIVAEPALFHAALGTADGIMLRLIERFDYLGAVALLEQLKNRSNAQE